MERQYFALMRLPETDVNDNNSISFAPISSACFIEVNGHHKLIGANLIKAGTVLHSAELTLEN